MTEQELDVLLNRQEDVELPAGLRKRTLAEYDRRRPPLHHAWFSWKWALLAAVLTVVALGAFQQPESQLGSAAYPLRDGSFLRTETIARPGAPASYQWGLRLRGRNGMEDGQLQQIRSDRLSGVQWGYRVMAEPKGDGNYDFVFARVDDPQVITPPIPARVSVKVDVPFEFALSAKDGLYIRLSVSRSSELPVQPEPGMGALTLQLVAPRVYFDGTDLGADGVAKLSSQVVMVARTGVGRFYITTLDPRGDPRYVAAGTVQDRHIQVQVGGHTWRIACSEAIASASPRTAYVYYDATYQTRAPLELGAGGPAPRPR